MDRCDSIRICTHCGLPVPRGRLPAREDPAQAMAIFCCFGCHIAWELARPGRPGGLPLHSGTLLLRLGLGIFLAINIMAFSWISYAQELFGSATSAHAPLEGLFAYLMLFLCTVVVVLLGLPLATDACSNVIAGRGRIDTNLLITIGVGSAYVLSAVHTLRGAGSLYFDTAAMVLVLVTLGNYLEAEAKRRAAHSGEALLQGVGGTTWVEREGRTVAIDSDEVAPGERVRVRSGEIVPVDGPVVDGRSLVDESSLTGESRPRAVGPGDTVLAGSLSLDGLLWVRARQVGAHRVIARVRRLLHEARRCRPPLQRLADRIAAVFVPAVVAIALGLFGWRAWQGDAAGGLFVGLSVLLISCPCALGLAAPLASWNTLRRAAAAGILVDSAVTLERAASITRLYFDKTGTLTRPEPILDRIVGSNALSEDQALALAATLECASLHPIARALTTEAARRGLEVGCPSEAQALPGLGVEATVAGRRWLLGNARLLAERGVKRRPVDAAADGPGNTVWLADGERVLARFDIVESLRPDARATLEALRAAKIEVAILTGDRSHPAARLAAELDLPVEAGLLPQDKLQRLESARRETGGRIAMVGDGVNDAPVLAAADVGIAMGAAADLAKQAGHVLLISDRLDRIPLLLAMARHGRRRIRLNLLWAFVYNAVGIPLAATGLLSPVFAALAMIASSLTIVALSRGAGRVEIAAGGASADQPSIDPRALTIGGA